MTEEPIRAEAVAGGYWREDGTFQAPEGWPDGAGWRVFDPETGETVSWGPATDLQLVAKAGDGSPADPGDYQVAMKGLPEPDAGEAGAG